MAARWLFAVGAALVLVPTISDHRPMRLSESVSGGGRTITVTTVQGQGPSVPIDETVDMCITRHTANVAAVRATLGDDPK